MATMAKETPLFIVETELSIFTHRHPEYNYFKRVYYEDKSLAGFLAYKEEPKD